MNRPLRVMVVTATRAEYGQLRPVMERLRKDRKFRLQIAVTGAHLDRRFGLTWREVENDGFRADVKIRIPLDDSPCGIARAIGSAAAGFGGALERLRPDLVLLLGDRYEILGAASAALVARIPIAHLCGGDVTEGVFDEAIRHSVTKMAHLHFVTHPVSARRVRQLGESPSRIHVVGNPALDAVRRLRKMSRRDVGRALGFRWRQKNLLVTFHPETLSPQGAASQVRELLAALEALPSEVGLLLTHPNADTGSSAIRSMMDRFARRRAGAKTFASMGSRLYLNAMRFADAVVGNSSSGISEAPSFGTPTVDIGDRQKGRLRATSVIHCALERSAIRRSVARALAKGRVRVRNPYGDGRASERIARVLGGLKSPQQLVRKKFMDLPRTSR